MGLISDERSAMRREGDPAAGLDITPEPIVPGGPPSNHARAAASVGLAVLTHIGFAALAVVLLQWRDLGSRPEQAIPVEIVRSAPAGLSAPWSELEPRPHPAPGPDARQAAVEPPEPPSPPAGDRSDDAKPVPPMLVEAPPDAAPAKTQPAAPQQANLEPEKPATPAAKPAPTPDQAPAVLTSAAGATSVPPPAPAPPDQRRPAKPEPAIPQRDPAAELAAAIPMDLSGLPSSFRAVLSGGGQLPSDEYKGVVFGRLGRSQGAIAEARERHLRGAVLVSFTVADDGKVADLRVGHSSGTPALDALALRMVREAAPFPPPPPDSQRSFNPVLSFGEN